MEGGKCFPQEKFPGYRPHAEGNSLKDVVVSFICSIDRHECLVFTITYHPMHNVHVCKQKLNVSSSDNLSVLVRSLNVFNSINLFIQNRKGRIRTCERQPLPY